ncbi:serine hydrolase [Altererythrobacter salegens]|uniref:Serine hydrolase n=1 Tax=Croceibacterium salegens TaxID=1737568 RepID=A0A6I4SU30_9SPHN|nr:serine hydrolase domain-containing protein [Croceibacterium salegens]MXO59435.1 serine hydrolase [Croceibacterium salegens]
MFRRTERGASEGPTLAGVADAWANAFHQSQTVPALACAVATTGGLQWSTALGTADLELGILAQPEHSFRIGSVSKAITAVAAARLVSQGLLELETPISYWLPDLPPHHRETTLLQLLTHRGGVRHYLPKDLDPNQPGGSIFARPRWDNAAILAAFIDDDLVGPIGKDVSYSSWGYTLASLVMEKAANQPFTDLIESEVGMRFALPSLKPDRPDLVVPGRMRGYVGAQERRMLQAQFPDAGFADIEGDWANAPAVNPAFCWAGAGLLMNMPDLARFGAALIDGPDSRITPAERELLFTPLTEKCDNSPPLGLGWRVDEDGAGRLRWHHAGATQGGRASLVVYPGLALSIAMAGNCMISPGDVLGPSAELTDIFAV